MNTCNAFRGDFRVNCDEPAGHEGNHSGMLHGARVAWDRSGTPVDWQTSEGGATVVSPEDLGILTNIEQRCIARLAEVWQDLCTIAGDGPTRAADLQEAVAHVHALQLRIMAQAAARAYPHLYRRLGEVLPDA